MCCMNEKDIYVWLVVNDFRRKPTSSCVIICRRKGLRNSESLCIISGLATFTVYLSRQIARKSDMSDVDSAGDMFESCQLNGCYNGMYDCPGDLSGVYP